MDAYNDWKIHESFEKLYLEEENSYFKLLSTFQKHPFSERLRGKKDD